MAAFWLCFALYLLSGRALVPSILLIVSAACYLVYVLTRWIRHKSSAPPPQARRTHGRRDHPRVCGENSSYCRLLSSSSGSPPRMRGKQGRIRQAGKNFGITPAHVGKTVRSNPSLACSVNHPRACGENRPRPSRPAQFRGSPPRMRGKLENGGIQTEEGGITPAHAGKTALGFSTVSRLSDHPRACGENSYLLQRRGRNTGSPPRMRGKLFSLLTLSLFSRITPAHAGKTRQAPTARSVVRDHPRACGENYELANEDDFNKGSPPRVRGKLANLEKSYNTYRITPARAGKTKCNDFYG